MMDPKAALRSAHLAETDWLAEHLNDPAIRIVDVRGEVRTQTDASGSQTAQYLDRRDLYDAAHIPGAVFLGWTSDLVDESDPVPAQVASAGKLSRILSQLGIGNEHSIVAYDDHPASQFATRLWWVLRFYGHTNCRVLNGGWTKWLAEQRPVSTETPKFAGAKFTPVTHSEWRRTADEVAALIKDPHAFIVDARDEGQYSGKVRRGARGGRIPGAIHLPREALIRADRTFEDPEKLAELITTAKLSAEKEVVAYCNGGVAATSVLFALSMLGYPRLSNYDGSWNEWSGRYDLPVESD